MRSYIREILPQVVGKSSAAILLLIDGLGNSIEGIRGKEKFWMTQNFPGRPIFGIMERGEDWKGPRTCSIKGRGKGPRYLPLTSSLQMIVLNSSAYERTELLLGGDCVRRMGGKFITKP